MKDQKQIYFGGCHCKKIRFEVQAPKNPTVYICNCSICSMKQITTFIVPQQQFKLLSGKEDIQTYTFNTKIARHTFCKTCGVQPFYYPRSNPDGIAISIFSLDEELKNFKLVNFDGKNWEQSIINSDIQKHSKL